AFYSNFSSKEEVFTALFDEVTAELIAIANTAVGSAVSDGECTGSQSPPDLDDAGVMLAVFEGIRPFGRQWYLLYSDAIARSLRDERMRAALAEQRERLRDQIGPLLTLRLEASGARALLAPEDLAQLLIGIFVDLMLREQMEDRAVTEVAATTSLGTLHAVITEDPPPPRSSSVRIAGTRRQRRARGRRTGSSPYRGRGVTTVAPLYPASLLPPGDAMSPYRPRHLTPPPAAPAAAGPSRRSLMRGGVLGAAALGTATAALAAPAAQAAGVHGQDVSGWQGEVDWQAQAALGSRFAYVKATEGRSYRSPAFDHQYLGAGDAGLVRGGYHFARPDSGGPEEQVEFF